MRLPIDDHLDDIVVAVRDAGMVVVEAPPGAGKTTRVPPALAGIADADDLRGTPEMSKSGDRTQAARAADADDLRNTGRVVVLEPRRVAARAAANRMAQEQGGRVGGYVGITTRDDRRRGPDTRIEVITEGVLVRRLQQDATLPGIATVVLDEFHERSLDADLSLAFLLETRAVFREELRLVVMSATLDGDRVAGLLGGAPVVRTEGRSHPVEIRHHPLDPDDDPVGPTADIVAHILAEVAGGVLVFQPGRREIDAVVRALRPRVPTDVDVLALHGSLTSSQQDAALRPARSGRRKVVVATDIAESSVTVSGVVAVVDAGWSREPRQDPGTGLSRLVTVPASIASADQRAGRAGREAPGLCVRLWSGADHARRDAAPRPGIVTDDLTGAALEVASWGANVGELALLDQPDPVRWEAARSLLRDLGAVDDSGVTAHGRRMARMPLHPRLAHMVQTATSHERATAVVLAALVQERDVLRNRDDRDLRSRVEVLAGRRSGNIDRASLAAARREVDRLTPRGSPAGDTDPELAGELLALAYPDRVATSRPTRGEFTLASGRGARVHPNDPLAGSELLVIVDADDRGRDARIWSAAPVTRDALVARLGDQITWSDEVRWDDSRRDLRAVREQRLGSLVLASTSVQDPDVDAVAHALREGLERHGVELLPWSQRQLGVRDRVTWLRDVAGEDWPAVDDRHLLATFDGWLRPFLVGVRRLDDLGGQRLDDALSQAIGWDRRRRLATRVPDRLSIPSGRQVAVTYAPDTAPTVEAKLQELFGPSPHPTIAGVPVRVSLLSPAGRPVHITQDLPGFWTTTYADVRADLRGRYPKHPWPEDPTTAIPTARIKRALRDE